MKLWGARSISTFAYTFIFLFYVIVGLTAAHPFDDAIYAQHAQFFYYLNVNPGYGLPMGLYYDLINIGGYFVTVLSAFAGLSNVLTIQIGVKIPLIVFTFMTAYFLYKIMEDMGHNGNYASLLLLTSPIYFFTSVIYGSALVVSMFFLVSSIYFLFRGRTLVSAILFGISVGSYLYPVFSVPFLLRYTNKEHGRKETVLFLLTTSAFAAIGQLTVLFIYLKMGYYGISPNTPAGYLSIMPVPYYSIFDILNIMGISNVIPGVLYNYIYYASSIAASLSYFLLKKERVNKESLLVFFLIQGVLFSAINPYNLPSYMSAMIPFAIMLAFVYRRWLLLGLLWLSSAFSLVVMQTINSAGFMIYFSDLNLKILNIKNVYPTWVNSFFGVLYSLSLLTFIPFALRTRRGRAVKFTKALLAQGSVVGVLAIVAIVVLIPVASNIPGEMFLSGQVNTFQADAISESLSGGSLLVNYQVPLVGFLGEGEHGNFIGFVEIPSSFYTIYNTSEKATSPPGSWEQPLSLPYPLHNATLELFGTKPGSVVAELANSSSIITPSSTRMFNGNTTYGFYFATTLSGLYELRVNSSVPLYNHNQSSLSIFLGGYPKVGNVMIGKYLIPGNYVPGYLLKSKLTVKFTGPFRVVPPFEPSFIVYLSTGLSKPIGLTLIEGGIMLVVLVLFPPVLLLYLTVKRMASKPSDTNRNEPRS